ncbi:alpha/beta fold hydrolase [Mycolicibacterium aichiense]|uniref:alpha/beta fold hydrolase n=1 Tax=Mycolicibacterium aichiense TaxID=1799 RepID=UPI003D66A37E
MGAALTAWDRPLRLICGLADPVSGQQVLREATRLLPRAHVTALDGVGHFPQTEAPAAVVAAIRADGA